MRNINRLAEVFKEKDIYNRDIAQHLKKSEETISRWVNNHRQPSLNDLDKISEFLRVDIRDMLHPSDWSDSKAEEFKKSK